MLESWPCLEKWSCEYLKREFGEGQISVDITPDGHGDCVIDGKMFLQPEQRQMKFGKERRLPVYPA